MGREAVLYFKGFFLVLIEKFWWYRRRYRTYRPSYPFPVDRYFAATARDAETRLAGPIFPNLADTSRYVSYSLRSIVGDIKISNYRYMTSTATRVDRYARVYVSRLLIE